jgi:hypothetical protein
MKVIFITKEKNLVSIDSVFTLPSISMRFVKNQLKKKKLSFIIITVNLVENQILLKLIEFFKHNYFKHHANKFIGFVCKNFLEENWVETYTNEWFKNFLNLNIRLKLDILKSAYLLNIIELTELLLYSILGFFLKKLNLYVLNIENR